MVFFWGGGVNFWPSQLSEYLNLLIKEKKVGGDTSLCAYSVDELSEDSGPGDIQETSLFLKAAL